MRFNAAYCIGGTQHGVKVKLILDTFYTTTENEKYVLTDVVVYDRFGNSLIKKFFKHYPMSYQEFESLALSTLKRSEK